MADEKKGIKEGEPTGPPGVQSTTTVTPAEADKTPGSTAGDAKSEDQPVRTGRPDVPIAHSLAAGSGLHTPPDPKKYDNDGRPKG